MKKIVNSLAGKIFLGYFLIILILLLVVVWAITNFNQLSSAINNIMEENYRSIQASEQMIEAIERQDSAILLIIGGQGEDGIQAFRRQEQEFLKWYSRAEDNITIPEEESILENLISSYTEYLLSFDHIRELQSDQRQEYYNYEYMNTFTGTKEIIRELRSVNQDTMIQAQQEADMRAVNARVSTVIISIIGIIIAVISGLYLSKKIISPVRLLQSGIKKVAAKNFNQKLTVNSSDEIGELTSEFNKMIDKLQEYENVNVRKLLEEKEKSEAIVNHISSPLLVTDSENRIIMFNQESKNILKLTESNLGKHILEVINNKKLFEIIVNSEKNNKTDNSAEKKEAPILNLGQESEDRFFKVLSNQVKNSQGETKFTVTLLEDITRLKEIDRLKSDFISTVSHEFRTPLTSITMALNMLAAEDVGDINSEQQELISSSLEDCERLTNLVEDLLDLSRMESGSIELDIRPFNIKNLVEKTISHFHEQAKNKSVNLEFENIPEKLAVQADPNKISWVISNLVGNALRYTSAGDKISISAVQRGSKAYLEVFDTGMGIKSEHLEKIFDKFFRSDNNTSETGSGLGLAIAKEIITAHQGRIWAESSRGEWTKFTFTLPTAGNRKKDGDKNENNTAD